MNLRFWRKKPVSQASEPPHAADGSAGLSSSLTTPITHRQFLKGALGALGGAGLALAGPAGPAQANYITGSPSDTVDTNLTIQGDLIVDGDVGIGTSSPAGKLDVADAIRVNGTVAIDTSAVAVQCYYAP